MDDLFSVGADAQFGQPLAEKMRPKSIDEIRGQKSLLAAHLPWQKIVETGTLPNLILWGPPGTGKTSFARIIGRDINAHFVAVSAVDTGAKDLREIGESGRARRLRESRRTVVFVDEIHRLNRAQQDVLLPFLESGDLILIGATTENPGYELNSALLSRSRVITFSRLDRQALKEILLAVLATLKIDQSDVLLPAAGEFLYSFADGDGRRLVNLIEQIVLLKDTDPELRFPLDQDTVAKICTERTFLHDAKADQHYDIISAFIKSVRGSDPDAAIYYLARMLRGGENIVFIARRLLVLASEDIGNADPRAISIATAGFQAVEMLGMPEARITLAQVTCYLAAAPKSNRAVLAIDKAMEFVDQTGSQPVPLSLRSAQTSFAKQMGAGKGYKYSHEGERGFIPQNFWPPGLEPQRFYEPTEFGFEKNLAEHLRWIRGQTPKDSE